MRIEWYLCLAIFFLLGIGVIVSLRLDEAIVQKVQAAVEKRIKVKSFKHTSKLRRKIEQLITTGCQIVINSNIPITVYFVITAVCSLGCFFAGRLIFASLPVSLAMGTLGLVAPLLLFKYREGKAKNNRLESCIVKVDTQKSERYTKLKERVNHEKELYKRIQSISV